jgi:hypothetical protein
MANDTPPSHIITGVYARLAKDGRHAVCERPLPGEARCGERLATVDRGACPGGAIALLPGFRVRLVSGHLVWLLDGRARRDWDENRARAARGDARAARRLAKGPRTRRPGDPSRPPAYEVPGRGGEPLRATPHWDREALTAIGPVVACPTCGMLNRLSTGLLDSA